MPNPQAIAPKPLTKLEVYRLQRELHDIAQPFINLISEVYSYSTYTALVRPGSDEPPQIIYPPETEALVQKYRAQMDELLKSHVTKFEEPHA